MKHIFVVHSHITYLAALGVIMREKLDESQVLILSENYSFINAPVNLTYVKLFESYKSLLKAKKYSKIFNVNIDVDNIINHFVQQDEYIAYIPVFHLINRYIITHPRCKKYNIIEEGLAAYYDYFLINQHTLIAGNRWRYSRGLNGLKERLLDIKSIIKGVTPSILAIPTFYTAYASNPNICFYGFHNSSYYLSGNRVTLSLNEILENYNITSQYNLDNSIVWIGDPDMFVKYSDAEFEETINKSFIRYIKLYGINKVYVRFHYRETDVQKRKLINILERTNLEYEIMDESSIMEIELIKSSNVTLVGVFSSLLLYGGIIGHKSLSIVDFLPEDTKNYVDSINAQISTFWKFVKKINTYI